MIPAPSLLSPLALATLMLACGSTATRADGPVSGVTAIDILLLTDTPLVEKARAANARLRQAFPQGFALDATHVPHMSVVQAFVRTADLEQVYEAVAKVVADALPGRWSLKAVRYDYYPWGTLGLGGIVIERTDAMLAYQQQILDAIAPYTAPDGTGAAFFSLPGEPAIEAPILRYVTNFRTIAAGPQHFRPHVTVGEASESFMNAMIAERFEPFTTRPVGAAIYQLGNFGAARKPLKAWDLTPAPQP